jgi:hypothetical protein
MKASSKLLFMALAGILIAAGIIVGVSALQPNLPSGTGTVTKSTTLTSTSLSTKTSISTQTSTSTEVKVSTSTTTEATNSTQPTGTLSALIADPVNVPRGSSHLYLNFSDIEAHTIGTGNSSVWVTVSEASLIDSLNLANKSVALGSSQAVSGHYDQVRFTIQSAILTYLGKNYSVLIQNPQSIVELVQGGIDLGVNSSAGFIVDVSSVVIPWQNGYSTDFELFTQASSVPIPSSLWNSSLMQRGAILNLSQQSWWRGTPVFPSTGLNIMSAILSTNTLLVVIQNNGAANVPLSAISIIGFNASSDAYYTVASFVVLSNANVVQLGQKLGQYQVGINLAPRESTVLLFVANNITTLASPSPPYTPFSIVIGQYYTIQLVNPYGAVLDLSAVASPQS